MSEHNNGAFTGADDLLQHGVGGQADLNEYRHGMNMMASSDAYVNLAIVHINRLQYKEAQLMLNEAARLDKAERGEVSPNVEFWSNLCSYPLDPEESSADEIARNVVELYEQNGGTDDCLTNIGMSIINAVFTHFFPDGTEDDPLPETEAEPGIEYIDDSEWESIDRYKMYTMYREISSICRYEEPGGRYKLVQELFTAALPIDFVHWRLDHTLLPIERYIQIKLVLDAIYIRLPDTLRHTVRTAVIWCLNLMLAQIDYPMKSRMDSFSPEEYVCDERENKFIVLREALEYQRAHAPAD